MPSLQQVKDANLQLKNAKPGLVAVFAGGTSGIGESTCKEFIRNTVSPRAYIIGRNKLEASRIMQELKEINSKAEIHFLECDLTLLRNVDHICNEIKEKENLINLLFMSAGFLSMKRQETSEGLDRMMAVQYYSRMRLVVNLLPNLTAASAAGEPARVHSALNAGKEGRIFLDDLPLENHFSLKNCATQATTMTTLAFDQLALAHPDITFIHTSPGIVRTNITKGFGPVISFISGAFLLLSAPFLTTAVQESGQRHLYAALSKDYSPVNSEVSERHVQRLNSKSEFCDENSELQEYRQTKVGPQIWEHTLQVFRNCT
ncbi:hypothetical protein N7481_007492 [Penicillium waksmanii]|uniref:uncharacterized protein n=1 Tax=Penicillium waksmanii TaxID=69791 RepID=UPI00254763E0|nr:uncharacterized protein N7481_007492 [Penicillium waksmanii]KAJ5980194.1 hypothetical protein N7481_007492 [Penicillium waksmanii]